MLQAALEQEVQAFLERHADRRDWNGKRLVVRNGYKPVREVLTGAGALEVQQPRVRDNTADKSQWIPFTSSVLPPYLRRGKSVDELIPWLYLKGISTGDFQEALQALLGEHARGLSPNVIVRLKEQWSQEYEAWSRRYRDCKQSWYEVLIGLKQRGLTVVPKLAVGDGALGFWAALPEVYPETREQRCWMHKTGNVLNKMPNSVQAKAKADLLEIWMAET